MNIPENILQDVADEAFLSSHRASIVTFSTSVFWKADTSARRAVIQHALDNPALAPFLAGGIGEYTDYEIIAAWSKSGPSIIDEVSMLARFRAFLSSLPRRESPAFAEALEEAGNRQAALLAAATWVDELKAQKDRWYEKAKRENELYLKEVEKYAEAIARAEKAEAKAAELQAWKDSAMEVEREWDAQAIAKSLGAIPGQSCRRVIAKRVPELLAELSALKSSQLGILRPIAEMPETVPEGCIILTGWKTTDGRWSVGPTKKDFDTHFAILRLPAAEARQERPVGFNSALETLGAAESTLPAVCAISHTDKNQEFRDAAGYCMVCGADWPEPAAQVPLGPEDCPPGSVFRNAEVCWYSIKYVLYNCVCIDINGRDTLYYGELKNEGWQINTSIPDTGRWDENAWRPCSKPAK